MIKCYYKQLRQAVAERRTAPLPDLTWTVAAVVCCTIAYIGFAMVLVPPDGPREYHFVNENGAATALSAFLLAVASTCSLASLITLRRVRDSHSWMWLLLAIGFAFLAFDEMLWFHERAGHLASKFASSGIFRSWDDIIVVVYGFVALPMLIAIMPGLLRWRLLAEMFAIAFAFYCVHTLVDSISEPRTSVSIILEESAKLLCGAFLALGAFVGFIGALWKNTR